MRKSLIYLFVFLFSLTSCSKQKKEIADRIYFNTNIYTVDPEQPFAEAIAIKENRILYVGSKHAAMQYKGDKTSLTDLNGKFMMPGFIESHIHPGVATLISSGVELIGVKSLKELESKLIQYVKENPNKKTIFGFGWSLDIFKGKEPDKSILDKIVNDKPVMLISTDAHSAWMNSKAFELLNINKNTKDPQPNVHYYKRDKYGNPTGWCVEGDTFWPCLSRLGLGTTADFEKEYAKLLPVFSKMGVTALMDAGVPNVQENAFKALIQLEKEDRLPLRYKGTHYVTNKHAAKTAIEDFQYLSQKYKSELFDMLAIKIPNDGTIEAKTAALKKHYSNDPSNKGEVLFNQATLTSIFSGARANNIDIHMHAIGDRTIHEGLNAFEAAKNKYPISDSRYTMCHVQLVDSPDLPRFNELGVIAQVSPNWVFDVNDTYYNFWVEVIGKDRTDKQFQNHSLFESGACVSLGSDFPASGSSLWESSPIYTMEIGQTRQEPNKPNSRVIPMAKEKLSMEEIIKGYTINAAYQLRLEDKVGSLEKGKLADLIVLSANPFETEKYEVHHIQVLLTMMDGKIVYKK
ncbi:amidohydrolase [Puteibacter caeruleilacunae]|nr:amidohydrolase [Puteibacter caeruleilacunae]